MDAIAKRKDECRLISDDRRLLQNQYAHLDGAGEYSAIVARSSAVSANPYARIGATGEELSLDAIRFGSASAAIEKSANALLRALWEMSPEAKADPILAINARRAANVLGVEVVDVDPIGIVDSPSGRMEVAAIFDRNKGVIQLSTRPDRKIMNFTAAHELGHLVLHQDQVSYHRDVPLSDARGRVHDPIERQANRFAVFFLMPQKLLTIRFMSRFGNAKPFALTEDNAFGLAGSAYQELRKRVTSTEELAFVLARATSFHGHHFCSLADEFNVSDSAMAYRLVELGLVN